MSAGIFTKTQYAGDGGARIYAIRVQPETLALTIGTVANAAPAGPVTEIVSAKVSGGRRTSGLSARKVRVEFSGTSAPVGYEASGTITLPILSPTVYAGINKGATGTYLGSPIVVLGKTPEYAN